jgi:2-polyprenyl-6-methoxyphenol hydroxylase-like FAD-dependent oxidoreductase
LTQEFDVVCLGGGVAGEAIAEGLQDSGLTLAVVERELTVEELAAKTAMQHLA